MCVPIILPDHPPPNKPIGVAIRLKIGLGYEFTIR